jgi:CYTH domain-containing protein
MKLEPGKHARVERERRLLVEHLPLVRPWADRQIYDIYIQGTRLRLRRSMGMATGENEVWFKLTQKIPATDSAAGVQGLVTTVYLSGDEYERFAVLPGISIRKRRLSYPPMGVDIFDDNLDGLMIAEAEFDDDPAIRAFSPPPYCSREVTGLAAFSGFNLASINARPKQSARAALLALVPSLAKWMS